MNKTVGAIAHNSTEMMIPDSLYYTVVMPASVNFPFFHDLRPDLYDT